MSIGTTVAEVFTHDRGIMRMVPLEEFVEQAVSSGARVADDSATITERLHAAVIGHEGPIQTIAAAMRVQPAHAGAGPRAIIVLEGPRGNGKTTLAGALNELQVRVQGGSFDVEGGVAALAGHPASDARSIEPGLLLQLSERGQPATLVLDDAGRLDFDAMEALTSTVTAEANSIGRPLALGNTTIFATAPDGFGQNVALDLARGTGMPVTLIHSDQITTEAAHEIFTKRLAGILDNHPEWEITDDAIEAAAADAFTHEQVKSWGGLSGGFAEQALGRAIQEQTAAGAERIRVDASHILVD